MGALGDNLDVEALSPLIDVVDIVLVELDFPRRAGQDGGDSEGVVQWGAFDYAEVISGGGCGLDLGGRDNGDNSHGLYSEVERPLCGSVHVLVCLREEHQQLH